ncbi:NAD-P-binding protein [Mycena galericulata]|nr:NAD-P-binding protein [Mycena galericulata]
MASTLARMFPPKFLPERDIPDLTGKVALVTGGNTGIGYETVKQLLLKNAKVYLAARSPEKAAAAIKRLESETKNTAIFIQLDLADLPSVRKAAESFLAQESKLDLLFNNGGVMISPTDQLTAQGYDLQFGTNVIGHFFLTELLLPALTDSYEESGVPARIINTSSAGHQFAPGEGIDFVSLKGGPERDAWLKKKLYGESKIGNIYVSNYFAKTYSDVLVSCALHPGAIKTELQRHASGWLQVTGNALSYPAPMGAYTQLWGATIATPAQINGQYLVPWGKVGKADKRTTNTKMEETVINYIKDQIKRF